MLNTRKRVLRAAALSYLFYSTLTFAWESPEEQQAKLLNCRGTEAVASVSMKAVPRSATSSDPDCGPQLWSTVTPLPLNNAHCYRLCASLPVGVERDSARRITGMTSHAWSNASRPQWFEETKKACILLKNWSAHEEAYGTIVVPIKPIGGFPAQPIELSAAIESRSLFQVTFDKLKEPIGTLAPDAVLTGFYCPVSKWEVWSPAHPSKPNYHFLYSTENGSLASPTVPSQKKVNLWGVDFNFDDAGNIYHPFKHTEIVGRIKVLANQ